MAKKAILVCSVCLLGGFLLFEVFGGGSVVNEIPDGPELDRYREAIADVEGAREFENE